MSLDRARYSEPEKGADGKWYFHLQGRNGEIQLASEGYESKDNAARGVLDAKQAAREAASEPVSISVTITDETGDASHMEFRSSQPDPL
jgi:uncharacterized protein YegP (UPF0339 family)